jgi:hypothetical protein
MGCLVIASNNDPLIAGACIAAGDACVFEASILAMAEDDNVNLLGFSNWVESS